MDDCIQRKCINIPIEAKAIDDQIEERFSDIFNLFDPITLEEMDSVTLMNRVDTKFLININQLPDLLKKAAEHYRIVVIEGERISPYSSIYFDTDDVVMYSMHHNGKLNRYKIRTRTYLNSGMAFLEVKHKNNKGRTSKKRMQIHSDGFVSMCFEKGEKSFIKKILPYDNDLLSPKLQNYFQRVTLVDKNKTERVTMDMGLVFRNVSDGIVKSVDDLVIVEMKQDGACKSYFREYLNELGVLPGSMSKYCLGMVLVDPSVKYNRFKKKLRKINKITSKNHVTI